MNRCKGAYLIPGLILVLPTVRPWAQPASVPYSDSIGIHPVRLAIVSTFAASTLIAVHLYQERAWWQGPRSPFRFQNDWKYALNIDKFGHAYGSYLESKIFSHVASWVGVRESASTFYGSVFGLAFQLYVELEDGFHQDYGFSPGDAFADILGSAIPLVQATVPGMENVGLKFSYYPSQQFLNDLKQGKSRTFLDDYEGQIFWVSMDPHFLMGGDLKNAIPAWVGFSLGAAVRNLDGLGDGTRSFYLTLDYNLSKIGTESVFLHALFTALDNLHFPAPGIGVEGGRFKAGIFY